MGSRSEITIPKILHAAERLFLEKSYADVTVDQIARLAEVTKGGVYHHFSSKEELYLAMMHADLAEKRGVMEHAAGGDGSCYRRLRRLTHAFLAIPPHKRELISLVRRDNNIFAEPVRTQLVAAYQAALPDLIEEIIQQGMVSGEVIPGDARMLAWHFVAMVEVTLSPYAKRAFPDLDTRLNHVLELFFHGAAGAEMKTTTGEKSDYHTVQ